MESEYYTPFPELTTPAASFQVQKRTGARLLGRKGPRYQQALVTLQMDGCPESLLHRQSAQRPPRDFDLLRLLNYRGPTSLTTTSSA